VRRREGALERGCGELTRAQCKWEEGVCTDGHDAIPTGEDGRGLVGHDGFEPSFLEKVRPERGCEATEAVADNPPGTIN
jgi:hypothetical protein